MLSNRHIIEKVFNIVREFGKEESHSWEIKSIADRYGPSSCCAKR